MIMDEFQQSLKSTIENYFKDIGNLNRRNVFDILSNFESFGHDYVQASA